MAIVRVRHTPAEDNKADRYATKDLRKITKKRLKYIIGLSVLLILSISGNIIQYLNNY